MPQPHCSLTPTPTPSSKSSSKCTQGKAIVGMKILGQGDLRSKPSEAIRYALGTGVLDAFTIGAESQKEQNNLIQRIAAA